MSEQTKTELSCGEQGVGVPWYSQRKWWLFNQDVGLPPLMEPWTPRWMDMAGLQRSLAPVSWPGWIPAPLFVPYISGSVQPSGPKITEEQYKWRVNLDVAHFSPSEISLGVRDGFLEVGGKHEERPDEHGFIARCFSRKYRLPAEIEASKIVSSLSSDGILTVEAPVPEPSVPATVIIPIKVEMEVTEEKQEKDDAPDRDQESGKVLETPDFPSAEDKGEESALEPPSDQDHPGTVTAGLQQHEEMREQEEESYERPAGESLPVPADGEGTESVQDTSRYQDTPESQEHPDIDTSKPEDEEIPATASSEEVAEERTQMEESDLDKNHESKILSQEPEFHDAIKQ
ncbi:uncharacterized protein V6R79_018392 [Siganus canaliculatus]